MNIWILVSDVYGVHRNAFTSVEKLKEVREQLNFPLGGDHTDYSYYPVPLMLEIKEK